MLPPGMPAWPQGAYKNEFESWGEFLGTGTMAAIRRKFKPYRSTKAWAKRHTPKMATKADWVAMVKSGLCPVDIPTDPRSHYKNHFEGWGVFLGTGVIAPQCRQMATYEEAKHWVREQIPIIHSRQDYLKRQKMSVRVDIPSNPARSYIEQFEGWPTYLGVRRLASTSMIERMLKQELASFLPVNQKAITRLPGYSGRMFQVDIHIPDLELAIEYDGNRFHQATIKEDQHKTSDLQQANPKLRVIRLREAPLGKLGEMDLLIKPGLDHFILTKMVVRHLLVHNMVNQKHYEAARVYLKRETPAADAIVGAKWQAYEQARAWASQQGLPSIAEWKRRVRTDGFLPADIPAAPNLVYRQHFLGWSDFLGTKIISTRPRFSGL